MLRNDDEVCHVVGACGSFWCQLVLIIDNREPLVVCCHHGDNVPFLRIGNI